MYKAHYDLHWTNGFKKVMATWLDDIYDPLNKLIVGASMQ